MNGRITLNGEEYSVLDSLEYIPLADSFVKNKLGTGHGEGKLYVGQEGKRIDIFFDDFDRECIFYIDDFHQYMKNSKDEFYNPQQLYVKKGKMKEIFKKNEDRLKGFKEKLLQFEIYKSAINPPRVYINSDSDYYEFMRSIGLPNISYLSIMKIEDSSKDILYYFKLFIDYNPDIISYTSPADVQQLNALEKDKTINSKKKKALTEARIGQGKYRTELLDDCLSTCPFTQVNDERLLVASHIKPWAKSDNKEKLDVKNGLVLTPTYDKLFDQGFISFNDDKTLLVSPWISPMNKKRLQLVDGKKINGLPLDKKRMAYMAYHRKEIFKG